MNSQVSYAPPITATEQARALRNVNAPDKAASMRSLIEEAGKIAFDLEQRIESAADTLHGPRPQNPSDKCGTTASSVYLSTEALVNTLGRLRARVNEVLSAVGI